MDIFQIILLLNLCASFGYFMIIVIILKLSGINPVGKRPKTKNKFGVLAIIISTVILFFQWILYIINPDIPLLFLSAGFITEFLFIKWAAVLILSISTIIEITSSLSLGKSGRIHSAPGKTKLIKNGIYGIIRNPIVLGLFLYGFSILLLNPNLLSLFMMILLAYGYNYKVDTEAEKLEEMFGSEWNDYCEKVGKYFPRLILKKNPKP